MKKNGSAVLVLGLLLGVFLFPVKSTVNAADMTCPIHIPVTIDLKPGKYPNTINLSSKGLVPVAVITTPQFDASQFNPAMAVLSDANSDMTSACNSAMLVRWARDDVNGDGKADLVFFFQTKDLNFTLVSTRAVFMAHGIYETADIHIIGYDSVKIVP